jgi:hypothetical protein
LGGLKLIVELFEVPFNEIMDLPTLDKPFIIIGVVLEVVDPGFLGWFIKVLLVFIALNQADH